jgi:hypothetical protein
MNTNIFFAFECPQKTEIKPKGLSTINDTYVFILKSYIESSRRDPQ